MPPLSILVVDDEQIVALDIRRTLERLGYAVCAVEADGPSAVQRAGDLRPDLVLMDIRLRGEMDGIQAAGIISAKLRIPVIYLTAYSDQATLERAKTANPFGFLIKPFEERELHSTIEIALLKHSAECRLDEARRKAEQENLAKSGYFADMSHEIRNSLNGIVGMTDLALDTTLSGEQREYLSTVLDSAENLLSILNDVLDISRIEARRLSLSEKPFDISQTVSKAVRSIRPDADKKGLNVSWDMAPDVPESIKGDAGRLHQILVNLLGNAIKFTERGSVSVEVNQIRDALRTPAGASAEPAVHLLFSVRDTGMGIPDDRLQTVFERYRQVDRESASPQTGSGLGLAICKELVELMDGKIWVRSRLNQGSTFYFTAAFSQHHATNQSPLTATPSDAEAPLPPLHVLATDDNPVSRKLLRMLLERQGHSCVTASNGLEMLALLAQERFDLVLTNIQMPRMGGLEAVRRIRSGMAEGVSPDIPVIAITAHALKGDRERFLEAGMTDYVAKPLHSARFYQALRRVFPSDSSPQPEQARPVTQPSLPLLDREAGLACASGDDHRMRENWQTYLAEAPGYMNTVREVLRGREPRLDITLTQVALGAAQTLAHVSQTIGASAMTAATQNCITALEMRDREHVEHTLRHLDATLLHTLSILDTCIKSL